MGVSIDWGVHGEQRPDTHQLCDKGVMWTKIVVPASPPSPLPLCWGPPYTPWVLAPPVRHLHTLLHCQVTLQQRPGLCLPVKARAPGPTSPSQVSPGLLRCTWSQDFLSNSLSNTSLVCLCPKSNQNQNLAKQQILYLKMVTTLSSLALTVLISLSTFERIRTCPHQGKNKTKHLCSWLSVRLGSLSVFLLVPHVQE